MIALLQRLHALPTWHIWICGKSDHSFDKGLQSQYEHTLRMTSLPICGSLLAQTVLLTTSEHCMTLWTLVLLIRSPGASFNFSRALSNVLYCPESLQA